MRTFCRLVLALVLSVGFISGASAYLYLVGGMSSSVVWFARYFAANPTIVSAVEYSLALHGAALSYVGFSAVADIAANSSSPNPAVLKAKIVIPLKPDHPRSNPDPVKFTDAPGGSTAQLDPAPKSSYLPAQTWPTLPAGGYPGVVGAVTTDENLQALKGKATIYGVETDVVESVTFMTSTSSLAKYRITDITHSTCAAASSVSVNTSYPTYGNCTSVNGKLYSVAYTTPGLTCEAGWVKQSYTCLLVDANQVVKTPGKVPCEPILSGGRWWQDAKNPDCVALAQSSNIIQAGDREIRICTEAGCVAGIETKLTYDPADESITVDVDDLTSRRSTKLGPWDPNTSTRPIEWLNDGPSLRTPGGGGDPGGGDPGGGDPGTGTGGGSCGGTGQPACSINWGTPPTSSFPEVGEPNTGFMSSLETALNPMKTLSCPMPAGDCPEWQLQFSIAGISVDRTFSFCVWMNEAESVLRALSLMLYTAAAFFIIMSA